MRKSDVSQRSCIKTAFQVIFNFKKYHIDIFLLYYIQMMYIMQEKGFSD